MPTDQRPPALSGAGKTTQVGQFLLDDAIAAERGGECNIICTQPRRLAAISVAERVAQERDEPLGKTVGYSIRLENKTSRHTRLLFCTTGILLRRLQSDEALRDVSCVILDEVHERSIESDLLLGILRDTLRRRPDFRLVLMSATVNAEMFSRYFSPVCEAPVLEIPGRTFPVGVISLENVVDETGYQVSHPHTRAQLLLCAMRRLTERRTDRSRQRVRHCAAKVRQTRRRRRPRWTAWPARHWRAGGGGAGRDEAAARRAARVSRD